MAGTDPWIPDLEADLPLTPAAARSLRTRIESLARSVRRLSRKRNPSVDAVHDVRVACRRADAAIDLYRELLPGRAARRSKRLLRKLRRAAGPIRAIDVLTRRLSSKSSPATMLKGLKTERTIAVERLRRRLNKRLLADRLGEQMADLLQSVRCHDDVEPDFGSWIQHCLKQSIEEFLAAEPRDRNDLSSLHSFRIAAKQLRYTLELFGNGQQPKLNELYGLIQEFQTRLGEIQDSRDACRHLGRALEKLSTIADLQHSASELAGETANLSDLTARFWRFWRKMRTRVVRMQRSGVRLRKTRSV